MSETTDYNSPSRQSAPRAAGRQAHADVASAAVALTITAIVPAHNAAATIDACLAALRGSGPEGIVVVDDRSSDDTAVRARAAGATLVSNAGGPGPAGARNSGAAVATGDILLFVDADVVVQPGTVARVREALSRDANLIALFGSYDLSTTADPFVAQYKNLQHHFVHQQAREVSTSFWAGCGAIRRDAFARLRGFDAARYPQASIEDIELGARLHASGAVVRLIKDLQVRHLKRWTLGEMIRTDVFRRAIPWSRLLIERGGTTDLNLAPSHRVSAVLAWLLIAGLAAAPVVWHLAGARTALTPAVITAVAAILLLMLNARFYLYLMRKRSWRFALRSVPLHWLYYVYSSAAYAWVRLTPKPHSVASPTSPIE